MSSQPVITYCPTCRNDVQAIRTTKTNGAGRAVLDVTRCPRGHIVPG